jgi:hypothetical protein
VSGREYLVTGTPRIPLNLIKKKARGKLGSVAIGRNLEASVNSRCKPLSVRKYIDTMDYICKPRPIWGKLRIKDGVFGDSITGEKKRIPR